MKILKEVFLRSEDVRTPDKKLQTTQGTQKYKKGYEIRLTVYSADELESVKKKLRLYNVTYGKPFKKARRFIIPIYGKDTVKRFLLMMREKKHRAQLTK
ncbi:MAG: hypothetical protein HYZ34_06775 [Ignavibacteriae bacterium]|nr:hypothetical protein [Ignavibacteriota bacterium]